MPGRIKTIEKDSSMRMAKVSFNGVLKEICVEWLPEVDVGDYVIVHAGFAISVLDEAEATRSLRLLGYVADVNSGDIESAVPGRSLDDI